MTDQIDSPEQPDTGVPAEPQGAARPRPWVRFWARQLDYLIWSLVVGLAIYEFAPDFAESLFESSSLLLNPLATLLWIPMEAAFLASWGATPGKWVLGTQVRTNSGELLSYGAALSRSVRVWTNGNALGIPVVFLFAWLRGYRTLTEHGQTTWDQISETSVEHRPIGPLGPALVVVAFLAVFGLIWFEEEVFEAPFESQAQARVEEWRRDLTDNGFVVEPISEIVTGAIANEQFQDFFIDLDAGGETVILGGCDDDCEDLDLEVFDPSGDRIALDAEPDAAPIVGFVALEAGEYTIAVGMPRCRVEPCHFALQALAVLEWPEGLDVEAAGSCFTVSPEGLVATAYHVVEDSKSLRVTLANGETAPAELVARLPDQDLALLRVPVRTAEFLPLATPREVRVGQRVFTIGFPATDLLGSEPRYTEGAVASLEGIEGLDHLLQISVPIQPGNSGGPVVDHSGLVVGVVSASATVEAFYDDFGTLPQNVNWASKASYLQVFFDAPRAPPRAASREEAVDRALAATCQVVAE